MDIEGANYLFFALGICLVWENVPVCMNADWSHSKWHNFTCTDAETYTGTFGYVDEWRYDHEMVNDHLNCYHRQVRQGKHSRSMHTNKQTATQSHSNTPHVTYMLNTNKDTLEEENEERE